MYKALYRECRPETFEEVLGQEHIVKILKNQLSTHSVSHAYLLCGTRGTGKTTMARLLAKGVNCMQPNSDGGPCGKCEHCLGIQ
ncbi:MAG: DNA polymerase III subunit gamma/tau, partial [Firmicutes bacterium]|nr:DNA polymerase III subunit gamma/tau [Bacillota bacterium]